MQGFSLGDKVVMGYSRRIMFATRRKIFLQRLHKSSALLHTAAVTLRGADNEYAFRPDSNFYYLTGFAEDQAAALFQPGSKHPYTLYVTPRNPDKERWSGLRAGIEGAKRDFHADLAVDISQLEHDLPAILKGQTSLYYNMGVNLPRDQRLLLPGALPSIKSWYQPDTILSEMRLIKSDYEITQISEAAAISGHAYHEVLKRLRECRFEYEVQALIEFQFKWHGAFGPSFQSIVAAGNNATTLHYHSNRSPLKHGDLILLDTGCSYNCYASDVSRTFPISGKFSKPQAQIYQLVLQAQTAVIKMIRPGVRHAQLQEKARAIMAQGLLDLGILKGGLANALKSEAFKRYYPHNIGHWLGLDVHDVGTYQGSDGQSRKLARGMVLTVEPGLYFNSLDTQVPKPFRGIGVRIEDDILVTATGNRILTASIPKEIADIEAAMGG